MPCTESTQSSPADETVLAALILRADDLQAELRSKQNQINALQTRVERADKALAAEEQRHKSIVSQHCAEISRLKRENQTLDDQLGRESKRRKGAELELQAVCNGKTEASVRDLEREWIAKHFDADEEREKNRRLKEENRRLREKHELPPPMYKHKMQELKDVYLRGGRRFEAMRNTVLNVCGEIWQLDEELEEGGAVKECRQRIKQMRWKLADYRKQCEDAVYHDDKAGFDELFKDVED